MQQNFATFQEIERITNIFELFFFLFFFSMKGSRVPNEIRVEIHEKFHNGTSISNLVEEYELHRATVHRIIAERYRHGHSRGRPKIVTRREQQRILAYMQSHPLACSPEVVCALDLNISVRTVQRVLSENNFCHNRIMKVKAKNWQTKNQKPLQFHDQAINWCSRSTRKKNCLLDQIKNCTFFIPLQSLQNFVVNFEWSTNTK